MSNRQVATDNKRDLSTAQRDLQSAKEAMVLAKKVVNEDAPSTLWHLEELQTRLKLVEQKVARVIASITSEPTS